jgi:hypothetical protein
MQPDYSYNPENTGARVVHALSIKHELDFKTDMVAVLASVGTAALAGIGISALLISGVVTGGAGFVVLAVLLAIAGGAGLGGGVAFFSDIFRTRQASNKVFEALKNPTQMHLPLDPAELKATIIALESNQKYEFIYKLFRSLSPKQSITLLQETDASRYEHYFPQNPLYQEIMNGQKNPDLLKNDPYYRALYEALMAKNTKTIDTEVFAMDFPNVARKLSESIHPNSLSFEIIQGENRIDGKRYWPLFKYVSPAVVREAKSGAVKVGNVQDFTQVMSILEKKAGILTREDFDNAVYIAEELGISDLKTDLIAMAPKRKDLFPTESDLQLFLAEHTRWSESG